MSLADETRDAIKRAAQTVLKPVQAAGVAYVEAQKALNAATDVEDVMRANLTLIMAAEALEDAGKEAKTSLRTALTNAMAETGAPEVVTMFQKATLSNKRAWVSVDQPEMLPDEYWNKPTPDKEAIRKALEAGELVPGTTLIRPNDQSLRIAARK